MQNLPAAAGSDRQRQFEGIVEDLVGNIRSFAERLDDHLVGWNSGRLGKAQLQELVLAEMRCLQVQVDESMMVEVRSLIESLPSRATSSELSAFFGVD